MTSKEHWVLPQGIEEALPEHAVRLEILRRDLLDLYATWGYELVMPPFIDHIESLLTGTGHDLDLQTFKLIDQVSGRTLGVRADMTPQVARIDAHQLNRDVPTRLCYIGTVLHARPDCFGGSLSPLQVGAELYGHAGVESDVEILGLMLSTFSVAGVDNVVVDLGNVDIFKGLARQANLNAEDEGRLFEMLQRKAVPEIQQMLAELDIDNDMREMLASLAELNGDIDVLHSARTQLAKADACVHAAIDYLEKTATLIMARFTDVGFNCDLAELHGYHYQTGVVFAAFVPGSGVAIARGGRYDDIGRIFGRARAATGFSTDLKLLDNLTTRQFVKTSRVYAPAVIDPALKKKINEVRAQGICVIEQLAGQNGDAKAMQCNQQLQLVEDEWQVVDI
ncbi:MAG: ATP phosphoribosyltransferase regulatory subunit [Gammaproteobacteria bacterium]|jgi:ATP phosphoribosyltransferase regulatory subunit|nr:ATP phosphoribosyltransferase regulatory subunit [Gammaproteobacteria bacterium]